MNSVGAPTVGDRERVSIVEVTPKYVTVRLATVATGFGNDPFRRIFSGFIDKTLRGKLRPTLEAAIVYQRWAHGVAFFLRPATVDDGPDLTEFEDTTTPHQEG